MSSENRTELAQKLQRETAVQLAYLKEKGQTVEPIYKTERETFDSMGNDVLEKVVERAGADEIKNAFENGDFDLLDKMADKAADALEEQYTHGALAGQNKRWKMRIDKLRKENRGRLYGLIEHAYKMLTDTSVGKAMLDVEATREAIREAAPEAQVERWAYDKLGDVLGEKGIRNQKDCFTRSGKSRSFSELHNPYSPKTKTGTLESRAGWKGLCRKGVSLLVVLVACRLDATIGSSFIRDATVIAFVCNETISIIENAGLIGVPIPAALTKAVDVLRQRAEKAEKSKRTFSAFERLQGVNRNFIPYSTAIFEPPLEGTLRKTRVIKAHLSILTASKENKIPKNRLQKLTFGDFILELLIRFERTTCSLRVSCSTG